MTNIIQLLKKDFGFYYTLKSVFNDRKARNKFVGGLFGFAVIIFYLYLAQSILLNIYDLFLENGYAKELIVLSQFVFLFLVLVFFTTTIISKFYFSNDIKILLRLPIKPEEIMASRIIFYAVSSLFYGVILSFPIIIKTGLSLEKPIIFYILSVIVLLLISLILINIITLFVVYIMKFINKNIRLKNLLKYGAYILFFGSVIALQFVFQYFTKELNETLLLRTAGNLKNTLLNFFPQIRLGTDVLISENIMTSVLSLFGLFVIALFTTFITISMGKNALVSGILNVNSSKSKKIKLSKSDINNISVLRLIFRKEIKNIFGTAIYLVNKVTFGFIMTIAFSIPIITNNGNNVFEKINGFYDEISKMENGNILLIAGAIMLVTLFTLFSSSGSELTSSTFSREGKNIWIMKVLPISAKDQILGRLLASSVLIMIAVSPLVILLNVFARFNIFIILGSIVTMFITSMFTSALSFIAGILWPYTNWDNPNQAIKGARSLIPSLLLILFTILVVGITVGSIRFDAVVHSNYVFLYPIFWNLLFAILTYVLYKLDLKLYKKYLVRMGN
ncbi:hypothetical protein ABGF28_06995 [Helcococcus ovis]|uniref:putative ABC transporter permease subunit n=1 Tax=Helcococcus ovis TaxID=72026 RepID=UPI0038B7BE03